MSAWEDSRTCVSCDSQFTLADYGHMGARSLAEQVDHGDTSVAGSLLLTTCPECKGQPRAGSAEAAKAAVALDVFAESSAREAYGRFGVYCGAFAMIGSALGFLLFSGADTPTPGSSAPDALTFGLFFVVGTVILLSGLRSRRA